MTVELFHPGFSSVVDTTYFGIELNLSAKSPVRDGHASAKPWYVTRPSRSASLAITSSSLNLSPCGPRSNWNAHPPRSKPSDPPVLEHAVEGDELRDHDLAHLLLLVRWSKTRRRGAPDSSVSREAAE